MAYNTSKGGRELGDIKNEDDVDTQIDFGSDSITLKTNNINRLAITNSLVSSSVVFYSAGSLSSSADLAVTGNVHAAAYYGDGAGLTGVSAAAASGSARIYSTTGFETSGYLKVTGSSTFAGAVTFNSTLTASQGIRLPDNKSASFGNSGDFRIRHDSTNTKLTNATGHVLIDNQATSKDIRFILGSDSAATEAVKIRNNSDNNVWVCDAAGNVSGSGKLELAGTGSVSGDFNVTGTFSVGSTAQINNTLTLSGAASEALRITKDDASAREIVFENGGTDKVSIYMNSAENFFIRQEDSSKDINLRVGTTNAVVVDGSATEVTFAWDTSHVAISGSGNLKVGGSVSASADVYVTGAVSANTYYGDGSNLTGISAGSVSGSARIYSTTGIETSGYLNVTGNIDSAGDLTAATITMNGFVVDADGDTNLKSLRVDDGSFVGCDSDTDLMRLSSNTLQINGTLSGSGILYAAGAANFSSTVAATGSVSGAGLISSGQISGSSTMQIVGNTSIGGNLGVTGSFRAKQLHFTHHAYSTTQASEKWIPFYTLSEANAPNNATYINQMTVPFDGILKRVIFRPSGSQGGGTSRITLFKASDQSGVVNTDEGGVYVEHIDLTCAGTVSTKNTFNFTGSSHFSAGDVVGISIDPHLNPVEVNVSCIWEFDSTSLQ